MNETKNYKKLFFLTLIVGTITTLISKKWTKNKKKEVILSLHGEEESPFVDREFPIDKFDRHKHGSFYKFRFIPYQRNKDDNVRLFVNALRSNSNSHKPSNRIGDPFILSDDNTGEDPTTTPVYCTFRGLTLFKAEIKAIIRKFPSFKTITLKPRQMQNKFIEAYVNYELYVDDETTGVFLNPSPPGLT